MSTFASDDAGAWATGASDTGLGSNQLVEHWNGANWNIVRGGFPEFVPGVVYDVVAFSPFDAWIAADAVIHWDGSIWTMVDDPGIQSAFGISAASSEDIWTFGRAIQRRHNNHWSTYVPDDGTMLFSDLSVVETPGSYDIWATAATNNGPVLLHSCPSPLVFGDVRCNTNPSSLAGAEDIFPLLNYVAGVHTDSVAGCPDVGQPATVEGQDAVWADLDCDESIDGGDVLRILRDEAGLSRANLSAVCPELGEQVLVSWGPANP